METLIGSSLRRARLAKGFTQWQVALKTKVSIRTVQRIEKGVTSITITDLLRFAHVLDISLCTVICTAEKSYKGDTTEHSDSDSDVTQDDVTLD